MMNKVTDAEYEVMKAVWELGGVATSREIFDKVQEKKPWSKTTVKTLISRLVSKGALKSDKAAGSAYKYKANISEDEYKNQESENLIGKLFNGSINEMLLNFTKSKKLSKQELEELIKLVGEEEK